MSYQRPIVAHFSNSFEDLRRMAERFPKGENT